jgi:two-component system sensor histidine kinase SenX3
MSTGLVIFIVAILGALAGGLVTLTIAHARQTSQRISREIPWDMPAGVSELLAAIELPAIIVDHPFMVVEASGAAVDAGLVVDDKLAIPELIAMVDDLRASSTSLTRDFEIPRGPYGDATISIQARASKFGPRYTLLFVADRTEFRRLEEVRRDFVANISHELKTPIGAISLLAEALSEAADDEDMVRHFADRLSTEAARLSSITREIIDLSRLQSEGALAKFSSVSIDDVVNLSVDANRVLAAAKGIDIVVGGDTGAKISGDSERLVLALNNLISNAIHYSPENSRVGVGIADFSDRVEIVVTDKGIGMTQEESERVFERFYRTDQARSRSTGGTGLGLAIVKHVINHHGGDVRVWSLPGQGSTFTIRLPRAVSGIDLEN